MQSHTLNSDPFPYHPPEYATGIIPGTVYFLLRGDGNPWTVLPGLVFDHGPGIRVEKHRPEPGPAVCDIKDNLIHLTPSAGPESLHASIR